MDNYPNPIPVVGTWHTSPAAVSPTGQLSPHFRPVGELFRCQGSYGTALEDIDPPIFDSAY